jgi:transposase
MPRKRRVRADTPVRQRIALARTLGIDVDRDMLVVARWLSDHPEIKVDEFPNNPTGHKALVEQAAAFKPELIVLESTGPYSLAAYDALAAAGLPITMINPLTVKALLRVEGKSDRRDAATLARLAAGFDLRKSNIPDARQRGALWALRLLFRQYDDATQELIRTNARLGAVLVQCGCSLMAVVSGATRLKMLSAIAKGQLPAEIAALHPHRNRRPIVQAALPEAFPAGVPEYVAMAVASLEVLERRREDALTRLDQYRQANHAWLDDATRWLRTVPFTTDLLALRCVAEMGPDLTRRYPTAERFCSALGVAPQSEVSGGKLLKVADSHGNRRMLTALVNSVKAAVLHKGDPLRDYCRSLRGRMGHSKALLATAHVVAEAWYNCTKLQVAWDPVAALRHRSDMPVYVSPEGEVKV